MVKQRLIFTLLVNKGEYVLSRNFRLQHAGDLAWIKDNYDFNSIALSIDELVVLNVTKEQKDIESFAVALSELVGGCFMPVTAGGGIRDMKDAYRVFDAGADKIVLNTPMISRPDLVESLLKTFGGQSIVASIDYKNHKGISEVYVENGTVPTGMTVEEAIENAMRQEIGEIYLTSMDRDGTGMGYDIDTLRKAVSLSTVPVIASGGVGKYDHLSDGIHQGDVQAVSTANLFAFIADGLTEARKCMKTSGIDLAEWSGRI